MSDGRDVTVSELVTRGRNEYARGAWAAAFDTLAEADRVAPLEIDDLERMGTAAHLIGRDDTAIELLERGHRALLDQGIVARAARNAFWLAMTFLGRGEMARAGGWLGRATSLLDEHGIDAVERGYVLIPEGLRTLDSGDPMGALEVFERIAAVAERFSDPDLATMARLGRGRSLIGLAQIERGVAILDEAMVAVTAGEVSPVTTGMVYCAAIEAFHEVFDLRRAQEWTAALGAWCDRHPDLIPFRGRCLVFRAELMQFHGAWAEAIQEVERAQRWLLRPPPEPAVGEAFYQQAELYRLRGEFRRATEAYREAGRWGRRLEPGLPLLRLAEGRPDAAWAMMRRAADEPGDAATRGKLLEPMVEIALAADDVAAARVAADELAQLSADTTGPLLLALADRAKGRVLLAEGDARGALGALRRAFTAWQGLEAPYETARVRVLIARALQQIGDEETAAFESEAARAIFRDLGAVPDLERVEAMLGARPTRPDGLSPREVEVLRLLAAGKTNREIAGELGISERTVDRHVSNIYAKVDVSTRAAATAFAFEHHLR